MTLQAAPFRHAVIDGWWSETDLRDVLAEFPEPSAPLWKRYSNSTERKLEGPPALWGPRTHDLFAQIEARTPELEELFGIAGLHMETIGGGYHLIEPGGYLNVHADFNRSPRTGRFRRLNLLTYLNDGWNDEGGHLELWDMDKRVVDVTPDFNRTVIFETSDHSWHGHPAPAKRWRRSVASYFFTDAAPQGYTEDHSTVWHG